MLEGVDPISDDELVYRRFPADKMPASATKPSPKAFEPSKNDNGLSVFRAKYHRPDECAPRLGVQDWYLAEIVVADIRAAGMTIVPKPEYEPPFRAGHAEIISLNGNTKKEKPSQEWQNLLAEKLCRRILGPFSNRCSQ